MTLRNTATRPSSSSSSSSSFLSSSLFALLLQFSIQSNTKYYNLGFVVEAYSSKGILCTSSVEPFETTTATSSRNHSNIFGKVVPLSPPPPCPNGYFCDMHYPDGTGLCKGCDGHPDLCAQGSHNESQMAVQDCQAKCSIKNNHCSSSNPCPAGLFCNYDDDGNTMNNAGVMLEEGFCEICPHHIYFCMDDNNNKEGNFTALGRKDCLASCGQSCTGTATVTRTSTHSSNGVVNEASTLEDVGVMVGSPSLSATGPIVNCGLALKKCVGVEDAVCLIERGGAPFYIKVQNCEAGGGIAAIIFDREGHCTNFNGTLGIAETHIPSVSMSHPDGTAILQDIEKAGLGVLTATVSVDNNIGEDGLLCVDLCFDGKNCQGKDMECNYDNLVFGDCTSCIPTIENNFCLEICNENSTCVSDSLFCSYEFGKSGKCKPCPKKTGQECFYSNLNKRGAEECSQVCADGVDQKLESPPCKFCPKGGFTLSQIGDGSVSNRSTLTTLDSNKNLEQKEEESCQFCAMSSSRTCSRTDRWDMQYPNRDMEMFGNDVKCWVVAEFYRKLDIAASSSQCQLARSFNHICGCGDSPGYAGADSIAKRAALEWLPRISAILSILGSGIMLIDVACDKKMRKRVLGQLLMSLSFFDVLGSVGYALTTLPTPEKDYIHGARGDDGTCKAQGFFIQLGTASSYLNVSLALYYFLTIRFSWKEHRLVNSGLRWVLLLVPVCIGMGLAFGGIQYYDNVVLWCNVSINIWFEIPVAVAITTATIVMSNLCWYVYREEKVSIQWSFRFGPTNARNNGCLPRKATMAEKFFWQSFFYLWAFYSTWPPYLALQFMLASGKAYSSYGFFLFAGTVVPLQGFWNFIVYKRTRKLTILQSFSSTKLKATMLQSLSSTRFATWLSSDGWGWSSKRFWGSANRSQNS